MAKVGRPSGYNTEIAATICARIAGGEALRTICKDEGMPTERAVYLWLAKYPEFVQLYAHAREEQADAIFEEALETGRQAPRMTVFESETGSRTSVDTGDVQHRRLMIDTLKWAAAKLRPKKYGDLTQVQGEVSHRHAVVALPPRTTDDPAVWAKRVQAERVASGDLPAPAPDEDEQEPQA